MLNTASDKDLVFTSRRFTVTIRSYGIKQGFITPRMPQKNSMLGRLFRMTKVTCF